MSDFFTPPNNTAGVTPQEAQAAAADQLQAAAAAQPAPDAGQSIEQMQQTNREVLLPMETRINDLMATFQASQDSQAAQIADLQRQLAAARDQAGPPAVEQYAKGVATLLQAHAAANPDLPPGTFTPALEAASKLQAAATDAVASRDPADLEKLSGQVQAFVNKGVGKHIDWSAVRADLELLGEAAARLAA